MYLILLSDTILVTKYRRRKDEYQYSRSINISNLALIDDKEDYITLRVADDNAVLLLKFTELHMKLLWEQKLKEAFLQDFNCLKIMVSNKEVYILY